MKPEYHIPNHYTNLDINHINTLLKAQMQAEHHYYDQPTSGFNALTTKNQYTQIIWDLVSVDLEFDARNAQHLAAYFLDTHAKAKPNIHPLVRAQLVKAIVIQLVSVLEEFQGGPTEVSEFYKWVAHELTIRSSILNFVNPKRVR